MSTTAVITIFAPALALPSDLYLTTARVTTAMLRFFNACHHQQTYVIYMPTRSYQLLTLAPNHNFSLETGKRKDRKGWPLP